MTPPDVTEEAAFISYTYTHICTLRCFHLLEALMLSILLFSGKFKSVTFGSHRILLRFCQANSRRLLSLVLSDISSFQCSAQELPHCLKDSSSLCFVCMVQNLLTIKMKSGRLMVY